MPNFLQSKEWLEFWKKASNKSHPTSRTRSQTGSQTDSKDSSQYVIKNELRNGSSSEHSEAQGRVHSKEDHDYWYFDVCNDSNQTGSSDVVRTKNDKIFQEKADKTVINMQIEKLVWVFRVGIYGGFGLFLMLNLFAVIFNFIGPTFFNSPDFWTLLGYGGNIENAPQVCHVIDFGKTDCRFSGGFSTPNHMAAYLLLILPVFISDCLSQFLGRRLS